jgi:branched-subunit amino acid aminotransferase/4-amino-4-deoxychorismate lyase
MSTLRYMAQAAFNGRIVATGDLRVSVLGDGFMFGHGLFETIKVVGQLPVFFDDHFARLDRSASALGLTLESGRDQLRARCGQVIAANALEAGNLKVILFQDEHSAGEIVLARSGLYPKETYDRGFNLKTEPAGARGALAAYKTLNYFENIAAKRRAVMAGCDEPVFVDAAGLLLEGATTNIFAVVGGRVLTPPADGRILPGVVRGQVLRTLGDRAEEKLISLDQLCGADEVFVTNALLGVMPVSRVDEQAYDVGKNPITRELIAALVV